MASRKRPPAPTTSPIAQAFSRWLRATREHLSISRYQIAKAGWVKEPTIKALEDHAHDPRLSTFVAVCGALGKNPATVLTALTKEVSE